VPPLETSVPPDARRKLPTLALIVALLLLVWLLRARCAGSEGDTDRRRARQTQVMPREAPRGPDGPKTASPADGPLGRTARPPTVRPHQAARAQPRVRSPVPDRPAPASPQVAAEAAPTAIQTAIPELPMPKPSADGEAVAIEVRVGDLASRTLLGIRRNDVLYLPADQLLGLLGAHYTTANDSVVAIRQPGGQRIVVAPNDRHNALLLQGKLHVPVAELAGDFDARATVLWDEAAVQLEDIDSLPIALEASRRQKRARLLDETAELQAAPVRDSGSVSTGQGVAVDYAASLSSDLPLSDGSYDIGVTNALLDGRLYTHLSAAGGTATQLRGDWLRVWNDRDWIRQLRIGDGLTGGPRPRSLRGVSVTNAPYARPIVVEELPFTGSLPPDWSIEAYRAGELVAFDSIGSDGRYALTLPVHYGENPTEFLAYGPFGEVRTFNRTFRALPDMLPAGRMEYSAAAGDCSRAGCSATGNLDLRFGATRRWTVRAGLDREWDSAGTGSHLYASTLGAPTNGLGVELETMRGVSDRAGLRIEPNSGLRVTADWIGYRSGAPDAFAPPGARSAWALGAMVAPQGPGAPLVWQGHAGRSAWDTETKTDLQLGAAVRTSAGTVRPYVRAERIEPKTAAPASTLGYVGLEATLLPRSVRPGLLSGIWIRGDGELDSRGAASHAGLTASKNITGVGRLEAGIRWMRSIGGVLSLGFVTQSSGVRSSTLGTQPLAGPGRVEQQVSGSVVWDPSARALLFSAEPAAERGGVAGLVFLDRDGDGTRDPGEPPLAGTRVMVAGRWAVTDSAGRFVQWGISPYELVSIQVDSTSLKYPWWVPAVRDFNLEVPAGSFRELSIPVVAGATLEGQIHWKGDPQPPTGRTLHLRHLGTGATRPVALFSDGSFYEIGVPPGDYELIATVPAESGAAQTRLARLTVPRQGAAGQDSEPVVLSGLSFVFEAEGKRAVAAQQNQ
jgi:hypothetical protein